MASDLVQTVPDRGRRGERIGPREQHHKRIERLLPSVGRLYSVQHDCNMACEALEYQGLQG